MAERPISKVAKEPPGLGTVYLNSSGGEAVGEEAVSCALFVDFGWLLNNISSVAQSKSLLCSYDRYTVPPCSDAIYI